MRHMDMMVDADVGHDVHFLLDADFDGTAESISSRRRVRRGRAGRVQCLSSVECVTLRSTTYQSVGKRAPFGVPEPEPDSSRTCIVGMCTPVETVHRYTYAAYYACDSDR